MLKLTRTGIGLLTRQYRSVLHKCWMINVGLWQAMGDAVSKAVSVPAKLVASLLSGGTMNGEAFNVLDEILLSRLFERKLASLTAIGLGIAAATMPTEALAITPDEVMAEMNKSSAKTHVTWTLCETCNTESYDENNHTGVKKIKVGSTNYYFSYTFDTTGAGSRGTQNTPASNKYYDGFSSTGNGGAINNSASGVILENDYFVGNRADQFGGAIYNDGTITTLTGNFSGNSATVYGGAINNEGTINTLTGNFSGSTGGAILNIYGTINTLTGDFSGNSGSSGGAINNRYSTIDTLMGDFSGNSATSSGGAIHNYGNRAKINTLTGDFSGNSAGYGGGAIYNDYFAKIETLTGDFSGNSTTSSGGAIWNSSSSIETLTGDFSGNSAGENGGAIFNSGTIGLLAKDKNISFYNNTDQYGYNDIYQQNYSDNKYISLAAASGRQISFGGIIDGNSDGLAYNFLNIGTDTTSGNYGGQYIFNNTVKNHSLVLGSSVSGANVVLGSIVQANGKTTYGKLENDNLTVNGAGSKIDMANGHVDANTLNTLTLNTDLGLGIDVSLNSSGNNADKLTPTTFISNPGSFIIDSINMAGTTYNDSGTKNNGITSSTVQIAPAADGDRYSLAPDILSNISGNNYYTQVTYDDAGNIVFSDKLINESALNDSLNNYYRKLMKKDKKFDTNEGIMDVKSLKNGTNSSQERIIKGVSAFPSNLCAYPFDMPHTANDNNKNVIVRSAKHDVTIFGRQSDNTATTTKQAA